MEHEEIARIAKRSKELIQRPKELIDESQEVINESKVLKELARPTKESVRNSILTSPEAYRVSKRRVLRSKLNVSN